MEASNFLSCMHTHKNTHTHFSHLVYVRSVTECMNLRTGGGKAINHAYPSVFFSLLMTLEATGGNILFVFTVPVKVKLKPFSCFNSE